MKRDQIIIFSLVGIMLFSVVAITLPFINRSNTQDQEQATDAEIEQPLGCQASAEVATQPGQPAGEWPTTIDSPVNELQVIDTREGQGQAVQLGDCITVHYRLSLADGTPVDGNDTFADGAPIAFELVEGGLIEGWVQGIPGLQEGGLRRLIVPAQLAYGNNPPPGIPADADLIFDVELVKIES